MTALRASITPLLKEPRRTEAEYCAGLSRADCAEATFRRIEANGPIDRLALMDGQEAMQELLEAQLLPAQPGLPYPREVVVTGYLTARQWSHALRLTDFAGAHEVDEERRPEDLSPLRTRRFLEVDWLRAPDLRGALTKRAVCELRARAAGKDFLVEIIADDTVAP